MPPILMRMGNARAHIHYLIEIAANFLLTSSNYTTQIEMEEMKDKYVQNMQSNRTFACFAKLKSDMKEKQVPIIDPTQLIYFQHNFKKPVYIEKVTNIDLKSAYATILFNDGFITKETFDYICKSAKKERLASVGMLASRKKIFTFKTGSVIDEQEIISEKSGFFFYAVQRTSEIMSEIQRIASKNYLYTWVDGIYFLPNKNVDFLCEHYLTENNFKYSVDQLSEFEVQFKYDNILVTFKKEGKRKIFNLPVPTTEFKRIIMNAILQANHKTNGKNIGPVVRARQERIAERERKKELANRRK